MRSFSKLSVCNNLALVLLLAYVTPVSYSHPSSCKEQKSCSACIGTAGCSWCKELKTPGLQHERCRPQNAWKNECGKNIVQARPAKSTITKNEPISKSMRINPQGADVSLGVGQSLTINLSYNDNTDKPLDLYYIMDLSATMEDDKGTVSQQAENMVKELRKITRDVRLGFGSFIDKPVLPFVSAQQLRDNINGDIPYGFRNWLSLTYDIGKFKKIVDNARISKNLDEPEGTLDALMQAITCLKEIDWRNSSRKLIVVATDGLFHIAGDGKIGGIVRPNDMECHMKNNMYTHSTILDYPTIGELDSVIQKYKVYVIFAVSSSQGDHVFKQYQELQNLIQYSTAVQLEKDSSNVVEKVKSEYLAISQTVRLNVEKAPKDIVDIHVEAKCSSKGVFFSQDYCTNVGVGSGIEFKITLKMNKCPDEYYHYDRNDEKVVISFRELSSREKLEINLNYNCKCDCDEPEDRIADPNYLKNYCNGQEVSSHISCGMCVCKQGHYGEACQCSYTDENSQGNRTNCIDPKDDSQAECSGRGDCKCGQCDCPRDYNGKYCQDSTLECRQGQNSAKLCSDNGQCVKGKCICSDEYEGKLCECKKSKKVTCVEPGKSLNDFCNGRGTCICNDESSQASCKCEPNYGGLYCGVCKINCPPNEDQLQNRCKDKFLQDCVRCRVREYNETNNNQNEAACAKECNWEVYTKNGKQGTGGAGKRNEVSFTEFMELRDQDSFDDIISDGTECQVRISALCYVKFRYGYQQASSNERSDKLQVFYKPKEKICEREPPIVWYIIGVILSVLLAGILGLLIWKLATYLHDRREYHRFEKETAQAKWGTSDNPLYNKPMSEFQNPAYRE